MKEYETYKPSKWENRVDKTIGLFSPRRTLRRMIDREKINFFRYLGAQQTSARRNSLPTSAGEWLKIQREKMQVMWNAIDMVDNSGLCSGMLFKFPTYVCGTLQWQARTGDKNINATYQQFIKEKTCKPGNIDITRRFSLRQMCILDIKSIALKGDVGTNVVRQDDEIYLQGIEANRIGDPYRWETSERYVRGLELDDVGAIDAVRLYRQERRSGTYRFDQRLQTRDARGLPSFLFMVNPISFDDYRGVSLFKHAIDNATYIDRMRQYELQALLWAASQSGIYYTKSGGLPPDLPFNTQPQQDLFGNTINSVQVRPNMITAVEAGIEDIKMFQHDRPSPNVIGMYENTVRDIAIGAGLTYGFVYDMTGITGPAVRHCSAQDARAIEIWQQLLKEQKLDQVVMLLLGDAIASGDLPYHPNWLSWEWFFPAKPTIDVGRESAANIEEIMAGVNTGANVVAEGGLGDIEDIITQRSHEIEIMIDAAQDVAQRKGLQWQDVYALMVPPAKGSGSNGASSSAGAAANQVANPDQPGATSPPATLDDDTGSAPSEYRGIELFKSVNSIYVLRHGKTEFNSGPSDEAPERIRGHIDVPLSSEGRDEAKRLGKSLADRDIKYIFTSDLSRASDTARAIQNASPNKPKLFKTPNLRPWHLGPTIEGKPVEKVQPHIERLVNSPDQRADGGESFNEFQDRWLKSFNSIKKQYGDEGNVAVVTHYRGMRLLKSTDGGKHKIDPDEFNKKDDSIPTGSCIVVEGDGKPTVCKLYDSSLQREITRDWISYTPTVLYAPDQARDDDGRFEDEGGPKNKVAQPTESDTKPGLIQPKDDSDVPRYINELKQHPDYKSVEQKIEPLKTDPALANYTKATGKAATIEDWSLAKHTQPNGQLEPDRQALHDKIVNKFLNPKAAAAEGEKPKAVMLIGKPGSGKTTAGGKYVEKFGELTKSNPDDIRSELPEYNGWNAPATQSESKQIHGDLLTKALAGRQSLLLDETGSQTEKMTARADLLGKAGYDVHVVHVHAPMATSAKRIWDRYQHTGRFVDPDYLLNEVDGNPEKTYSELKKNPNVKSWVSLENDDNKKVQVVDQGSR